MTVTHDARKRAARGLRRQAGTSAPAGGWPFGRVGGFSQAPDGFSDPPAYERMCHDERGSGPEPVRAHDGHRGRAIHARRAAALPRSVFVAGFVKARTSRIIWAHMGERPWI